MAHGGEVRRYQNVVAEQSYLPVFQLILLFSKFALHLLKFHRVLVNGLCFLINLFLEGPCDLHHLLVMSIDLISGLIHVILEVLQAERTLVHADIE